MFQIKLSVGTATPTLVYLVKQCVARVMAGIFGIQRIKVSIVLVEATGIVITPCHISFSIHQTNSSSDTMRSCIKCPT